MHKQRALRLHHQRLGDGPPLVIFHGLFGSGTNWRSTAHKLADCREIFLPDARNHGASEHAQRMDYLTLAQDALDFMDQQGLAQADIMGHSMGGKTAMHLALAHPERVRSLLIVDIAPVVSPADHLPLIESLLAMPLAQLTHRGAADQALAKSIHDPGLRAFLLQNLVTRDNTLSWRINLPALLSAMTDLLDFPQPTSGACYRGPTLFLSGEHSDYIRDEHTEVINGYFSGATINTLADSGHWLHVENPEAFTTECRIFFGCPGA